uniref:Eukaryotic translation initiation factor 3 subunit K n=1 Tax=Pyramimonas obovata TaxID=1411642 RepID=A0A7S0RVG5_9CHLO|mmetsp:Transcript_7865/g.16077  ORF Transcript_7865/g.16077 Transcript_7865/m.16077 type:complete len:210 (+) Transcript_7865:124-753(+)|eukprot:CAMPEP_0118921270 /NCGR_PEP_ID=MMETSP1169-20130426/610_1 /TAXON_ID=36882 /ORGANISM="Pyramimonas obovata, Strain CCMP722" /LENGTH=209 /DNA_ID=CAMNT_0006861973 /DNA_START=124 /DNA_END=753 /DNA_ORIENTATION=-
MEVTGADRYNPELLPQLEANVERQVQTGTYNLDTNLCLLRLYQFYPERVQPRILSQLLLKAMMALPNRDYDLCLHMIHERFQVEEPLVSLNNLSSLLVGAKFRDFWLSYMNMKDSLDAVPGFKDKCRSYIVHVLCSTYQKLPKSLLGEAMFIEGAALDNFINTQKTSAGWTVDADMIVFPANEDNHPVAKKAAECIPFLHVSPCLKLSH